MCLNVVFSDIILKSLLCVEGESGAKADGWRSGSDMRKMYESVTPNPTGSLSGPYFLQDTGGTVTGNRALTQAPGKATQPMGTVADTRVQSQLTGYCYRY
jgi:hypothetical protein